MNRIAHYFKKGKPNIPAGKLPVIEMPVKHIPEPADKSPLTMPENAPDFCAFCLEPLAGKEFRAFSKVKQPNASAICCNCVDSFALMSKFSRETFDIYFNGCDYAPLRSKIMKRFLTEQLGAVPLKKAVADLAIRMLKRGSAVLAQEVGTCRKTGVDLKPIRVAFVGQDAADCAALLKVACAEIAMAFMQTDMASLQSGEAYKQLAKAGGNSENQWADLGVLFCVGYAVPNANCSVIYACNSEAALPQDVEVIKA